MKTIFTFLLATLFTAGLMAQNTTFATWDRDDDGLKEREEFTAEFIENYFSAWDTDDERGIIEEEFFREAYAGLDSDDDRMISDEEWMVGYNYFYEDYIVYEDVDYVDVNEDGMVSYEEYYDTMYDTRYFSDADLDGDNYISEYELANYVFENWDVDDSGTIGRGEFNRFDQYYLDV